jgi:hypothetical protein
MARVSRPVISDSDQNAGLYPVFTGFFANPAMKVCLALWWDVQTATSDSGDRGPESGSVNLKNVCHLPDGRIADMAYEMVDERAHFCRDMPRRWIHRVYPVGQRC